MANGLENIIAKTRIMAGLPKARDLNDRQLLEQFADGDETAFTALVDRYGGLVMGVCQRVLQHTQDAEDAFQATFMVLARKAGKITWEESVANWLHGVACRIAFQVRREKARHAACSVADYASPQTTDPTWNDLKPVLDEEIDRLPVKYRMPLILCCLEGKTRDEAAEQLGWSVGSVKGRLERGREILRSRLAKRGITLSAVLAATLITAAGAKAAVPLTLGLETVRAGMAMLGGQTAGVVTTHVLSLTEGVLHAMFITKLKFAAAVVLTVITLGLGTGYVAHRALAGTGLDARQIEQKKENNQKDDGQQNQKDDGQPNQDQASFENLIVPTLAEFLAQREERKALPSVSGLVITVDAKKIAVRVARGETEGQTYDVAKDVKVVLRTGRETKEAKLADVKEKARVTLILDDAKKIVQTIEIIGERAPGEPGERRPQPDNVFRGLVSEIDLAKKTISFQTGGRGNDPVTTKTFDLGKDVKVTIRTGRTVKDGKIEDVLAKTYVQVKLDDTKKIVQSIEIAISTTAFGTVSDIDANSITVTTGREELKSETYALAKDVKVQYQVPGGAVEGRGTPAEVKALKLAEVVAKLNVTLQLDDARKTVQIINVQLPSLTGTVQEVDAKKGTLTIRGGRDVDTAVTVAKGARILIDGKAGTLDKVTVGAEVLVILAPDRMQVLSLQTPLPVSRREE